MENILSVRGLRVEYRASGSRLEALKGVDLDLEHGRCIGIAGESGCGKSTLALAVLDLINRSDGMRTSGKVMLKGRDITALEAKEMRKIRGSLVSLVMQDPFNSLNPVMRIGEQLEEAYAAHHGEKDAREAAGVISGMLKDVELPDGKDFLDSYPHQLSGGMLQRVCIAAALVNSPELLIADEPTSNLDVTIQKSIINTLKRLKKEKELSMLFITHNLNLVAEFADDIYIFYAGEVIERGPAELVFRNPLHPYTRGLLAALPGPDSYGKERIPAMTGGVPRAQKTAGCGFRERCAYAGEECAGEISGFSEPEPGHFARCPKAGKLHA